MNSIKINATLILDTLYFPTRIVQFWVKGTRAGKELKITKFVVISSQTRVVAHDETMMKYYVVSNQIHLFMEHHDQKMTNYIHLYTMSNYLLMCHCTKGS